LTGAFQGLGPEALRSLANALESGIVRSPFGSLTVQKFVPRGLAEAVSEDLTSASAIGLGAAQLVYLVRLIADERERQIRLGDQIGVVWSGPELPGSTSRDTGVVVRELFASARHSVLVSGYAVYQGKRVFEVLASNFDERPELRVRMFLNVARDRGDERADSELLREFAERFRNEEWPGRRLPEVYYDPRALSREPGPRACLHAKCLVVDGTKAFVSSANFTEAAQERNIEAGLLVESPEIARDLCAQFETLVQRGLLRRLPAVG